MIGRWRAGRCERRATSLRGAPLERRLWRVVLCVGMWCWIAYGLFHGHDQPRPGLHGADLALSAATVVAAVAFVLALLVHHEGLPYDHVGYAVGAAAAVVVYALAPVGPGSALPYVFVGFAAARHPIARSAATAVIASAGMALTVLAQHRPAGELWSVVGLLGLYAGVRASRTREAARRTEQRNLVLAERAHIAREIHDILAHSLSAQLVHLEGARLLIANGRTEEGLERVERARGLARSGLEETRRALATLRGDIPAVDEVLRELADEHRVTAGVRCEVTITGVPRELDAKAGLAVIRTAQEALTNARKHAPGADITIELRYLGDRCELEVTDSGGTGEPGHLVGTGGGYGLVGMRERAELIGGTLDAGPEGKGFRVSLGVPF